jgi:hypothetical protein
MQPQQYDFITDDIIRLILTIQGSCQVVGLPFGHIRLNIRIKINVTAKPNSTQFGSDSIICIPNPANHKLLRQFQIISVCNPILILLVLSS